MEKLCKYFIFEFIFVMVKDTYFLAYLLAYNAKQIFGKGGLRSLYFTFVHSYLKYGHIALGTASKTKLKKLGAKQKQSAASIMTNKALNTNDKMKGLKLKSLKMKGLF